MKTRKLLCLGLAVMLACPVLSQMPVHAQETIVKEGMTKGNMEEIAFMESGQGETDGFEIENGVLVKYTGTEADVEVPAGVTSIGIGAFQSNSNMVSIRMPDSVAEIGNGAFVGCGNLKIIQFSDHLYRIGDGAFYECDSLETISFPESLSAIGEDSFYGCWKLADLLIPGNVKAIGDRAFAKCSRLTSVMISEGVEDIGAQAFYRCMDLKSVTIPDSVKDIAVNAFEMIGGLTIYGSEGSFAQAYAAENNISFSSNTESKPEMFDIRDGVLVGYHGNVPNVVIPEGVTSIGDSVFEDVRYEAGGNVYGEKFNIQTVVIPEGVTNIGKNAFFGCKNLVSITIPSSVTSIGSTAFWKTGWLERESMENPLVIVNNILVDGDKASGNVVVPEGVTNITGGAFSGCKKLTGISLPSGLRSIGEYAFSMCESLAGISLPSGLASIGDKVFNGCENLSSVTIPENVASIGEAAFSGCHEDFTLLVTAGSYAETYAKDNEIPFRYVYESGHDHFYQGQITKEPGCTTAGVQTYTCSECGDSYTEPIAATGHKYDTTISAASIRKDGSITKTCTKCGDKTSTTIYAPKTISFSKTEGTYNGKQQTPNVTVRDSKGKALKNNADYTVSYPKNVKSVGQYTVTINFKGNYSGNIKKTFIIVPKGTSISKITPKKKGFTVKWKKQATQTTGYEVAYSTDSKFSKKNTKTVSAGKNNLTSKSVTKLKAKKKYYVRIRTYKTAGGKKYYSDWSKMKNVTTKK